MQEILSKLVHINLFFVFLEGLLSFFSPCIFPLIPLYVSYLAGDKKGSYIGKTICFVIGISFAFFFLGLSMLFVGSVLTISEQILKIVGGIIIIFFGFLQLKVFHFSFFDQTHKISQNIKFKKVGYLKAFFMGFSFSFAWTPCVGPMLSSVLLLAGTESSLLLGNLYIGVYALGFVIPFLILGLFANKVLDQLKKKEKFFDLVVKLGGVILVVMGTILLINGVTTKKSEPKDNYVNQSVTLTNHDFTLFDQTGKSQALSDLSGNVIFLNFLDFGCIPCQEEVEDVERLYQFYQRNKKDVKVFGIVSTTSRSKGEKEIKAFQKKYHITFPILIDVRGSMSANYEVKSFPTTYMIEKNGGVYGKMIGALEYDIMKEMVEQTKKA